MSLKTAIRKRLFEGMIGKARKGSDSYVVLVVDGHTTKILSSCCRMYDIMEQGVLVLENLMLRREPLEFSAIYFISPTPESIKMVINDFANAKKPQYSSAHLFFTGRVSNENLLLIKESQNLLKRIKTFQEINLDFKAVESRVFSFYQHRNMLKNLYWSGKDVLSKELSLQASRLVSVLLTLEEDPYIRFNEKGHGGLCKAFARYVAAELKGKKEQMPDWKQSANRDRGSLIIIDRSMDPLSPLMHEYTFQAMVYDLLKCRGEICHLPEEGKGGEDDAPLLLDENDDLWMELRHSHIGEVLTHVTSKFKEFKGSNKMAQLQSGGGDKATIKDMIAAMKSMPKYKDMMRKYAKGLSLAEACMTKFNKQRLKELGELEQDMATGKDDDGNKVQASDVKKRLIAMCQAMDVGVLDKLRLLMVYIISQGGIQEATRKQLMQNIDHDLQRAIINLDKLGVDISTRTTTKLSKTKMAEYAKLNQTISLALMRYIPFLNQTVLDHVTGTLSDGEFPYLEGGPRGGASKKKKGKAARMHNWRKGAKKEDNSKKEDSRPYVIVFVVGGITYAELRCIYDIGETQNVNIIAGSATILQPSEYVRMLANLNTKQFRKAVMSSGGTKDEDILPDVLADEAEDEDSFDDA